MVFVIKARRFVDLRQKISWKGQIPIRIFLTIYNCYCRIAYVYNESFCRVYHYNIIKNSIMKSLIFAIIHYSGTA